MITYSCHCGNTLHFENSACLSCGRKLGFLPEENVLSALQENQDNTFTALVNGKQYRTCKNYHEYDVCNWMVPDHEQSVYCQSCQLTEIIPDLTEEKNITLWYRVETAKRRLLYTLNRLALPIDGNDVDPVNGLSFRFMVDDPNLSEFDDELVSGEKVMTGHSTGTITINLAEADPSLREETREKMNERYRTLLGHFRHESGHYYWDKLIRDGDFLGQYRDVFGDERQDYQASLSMYYQNGPVQAWEESWISAYASSHPWEDFAETWAHYLHMVDTLETAHDYGFSVQGQEAITYSKLAQFNSGYFNEICIDDLLDDWIRLTSALNAMNRSMGLEDAYPFVLSAQVSKKLDFIHRLVSRSHR